jgi:transcriptional regulator with XRE-family HTH domain
VHHCIHFGESPPVATARLIADALKVPLAYLFCEDDPTAGLLLSLHQLGERERDARVQQFSGMLAEVGT